MIGVGGRSLRSVVGVGDPHDFSTYRSLIILFENPGTDSHLLNSRRIKLLSYLEVGI